MTQGNKGAHTQSNCVRCDVPQLARNNYFTGKLLVERDFTDEQLYNIGKQRGHNRYLHGSGCVCGLRVKQHPYENCRDQYIVIEPGTAIDCCGRELLVSHEEYLDFRAKIAEKKVDLEKGEHTLQICLRYSECPAEQVPVLFDDCSSDGTDTQPNRIIEGYDLDVRIDPKIRHRVLEDVDLDWRHTINVASTSRFALDEARHRLYVLTSGDHPTLYAYRTDNYSLIASHTFTTEAMDLALSTDGTRAYVSLKQRKSVQVLDTDALGKSDALINELPAHHEPSAGVWLTVSPGNGYLYVLDVGRGTVTPWRRGINHKNDDVDDFKLHDIWVRHGSHALVASPDGRWVFVANSEEKSISAIDVIRHEHEPIILRLEDIVPRELAVADTADGLKLYVGDRVNKTVSILNLELRSDPPFTLPGKPFAFEDEEPVAIAISPGGRWLYVLLANEAGKGRIQVIDAHRVERREGHAFGASLPVGSVPRQLVLVHARQRLYAGFHGTSPDTNPGGVAIVHAHESTCEDLLKGALDECPDCDDECIVLATIRHYKYGNKIEDDHIDNLTDRRLLPGTALVTDVVRCILENGGGKGRRGEEGPPGRDGEGIEAVKATIVDWNQPGSASIREIDEKRTLVLEIPRGRNGIHGIPAPAGGYTQICGINWPHRGTIDKGDLEDGLLITFSRRIRAGDINSHTLQVLTRSEANGLFCWCELAYEHVKGVHLRVERGPNDTCNIIEIEQMHPSPDSYVNGAWFKPTDIPPGPLRVVLKGDFIRDERGRSIDANHLPPWLPDRSTGDGVEGGLFESWFTVRAEDKS